MVTSMGDDLCSSARVKNCQVAGKSRFSETNVDNLAELVDCPVQVDPSSSDFDVCFVNKPSVTRAVSAGSRRVDQQRCEALHPPKDRDVSQVSFMQHEVGCANAVVIAISAASALQLHFNAALHPACTEVLTCWRTGELPEATVLPVSVRSVKGALYRGRPIR